MVRSDFVNNKRAEDIIFFRSFLLDKIMFVSII